jgi:hypothetical protein
MPSKADFNAGKSHLSDSESHILIDNVIRQARRGFPLTPALIADYANRILRAKKEPGYGSNFSVGVNWASKWLKKWKNHVSPYWSTSLETVRANALTPENVSHWFNLYHETVEQNNIPPERQWQIDEVGIMMGKGRKKKVVGEAGKRVQHTQQSGNREMITLIPAICGDGTYLRPTAIFKGKNLQRAWVQNNPLHCR